MASDLTSDVLMNRCMWQDALAGDRATADGIVCIIQALLEHDESTLCGASTHLQQLMKTSSSVISQLTTTGKFSDVTRGLSQLSDILAKVIELRRLLPSGTKNGYMDGSHKARGEIRRLSKFLQDEIPEQLEEGSAVDNAIRLLRSHFL